MAESRGARADVTLTLVAVDDIGAFATFAFDHPDAYLGKTIEIAGDILTLSQIAAAISYATGRSIPYAQFPIEIICQRNADFACALNRINEGEGALPDLPTLHKLYPDLMYFDVWLEKEGKARFESFEGPGCRIRRTRDLVEDASNCAYNPSVNKILTAADIRRPI